MIHFLNANAGAVTALTTLALLAVTGWYAWITRALLSEARQTRLTAGEPRVVAYLRPHEVHSEIVQLCIANLSAVAAVKVSASIENVTDWPARYDFGDMKILQDLSYLRPHEAVRFDLAHGEELFRDDEPAVIKAAVSFEALDGRQYSFADTLKVESVAGMASWRIYGMDDVARRLQDIVDTLKAITGFERLRVDTYSSTDRDDEARKREEWRTQMRERKKPASIDEAKPPKTP